MNNLLCLVQPRVETGTLEATDEKATYLVVPKNLGEQELAEDIRLGAAQLLELQKLVQKAKCSRYILINTDNVEQGYVAVSYLASILNAREMDVDSENFGGIPFGDEGEWMEEPYKIPIIKEAELKQSFAGNNGRDVFGAGQFLSQGIQQGMQKKPYWYYCRKEMVCVEASEPGAGTGFWGFSMTDEVDEQLSEGLAHFKNNRHVFIINRVRGYRDSEDSFVELDETETANSGVYVDAERARWNYVVLSYAADEVSVCFERNKEKGYYKQVLKGVAARKGLCVANGNVSNRVVTTVLAMKDPAKCAMVGKIVDYALKDNVPSNHTLAAKDFLFLDRFVTSEERMRMAGLDAKAGDRKPLTASERLEQELVGMEDVKKQVREVVDVMKFIRLRQKMHIHGGSYHNVHVMLGAPGTAKTTVAELMGKLMAEEGLLPDVRFACVNGAELKGMYVGHSAPKTKELFENHDIIVIDEAYSLVGADGKYDQFSNEAIAQLIIELEKHSMDKLVIFAGYGGKKVREKNNKMKNFLDANPGIKSRITSTIYFDSYTPQELTEIFYRIAKIQNYKVEEAAREVVCSYFRDRLDDENFGNGREARSLLETAVVFAARRVFEQKKKKYKASELQTILASDVEQAVREVRKQQDVLNFQANRMLGFGR